MKNSLIISGDPGNKGVLKVDASCTPAYIKYPTDLNLLNEGREKLEKVIDSLYEEVKGKVKKPRTYRRVARKVYLSEAKKRRHSRKYLRKAVGKQLGFMKRDLKSIEKLLQFTSLKTLSSSQYKELLVIAELFRQQKEMHRKRTHNIDDRIVNISQPHIRPIVRGKAKAKTEFGAKISISVVDGFTYLDYFSFDSYNKGTLLEKHIGNYKVRFGYYPKAKALIKRDAIARIELERKLGYVKENML